MIDLNQIRQEFADFLAKDPTRWRMDAALAHVVELAYRQGLADAAQTEINQLREALAYAIAQADGWHDDGHGGPVSSEEMTQARALLAHMPRLDPEPQVSSVAAILDCCPRCGGVINLGKALVSTYVGAPDFPGQEVATLSPGGPGRLTDCLKCEDCGWSAL